MALIPLLIIVLYYLVAYFFSNIKTRMLAILFVVFASGLGGILMIARFVLYPLFSGWLSLMDLWAADGFIFFTLFHSPHFMLALSLMLLIFLWTILALEKKQWRYSIYSGLAALILFQFHPYDIPTTVLVMVGFVLLLMAKNKKINWFNIKHCLLVLLISSPALIYHLWTYRAFWLKQIISAQNDCFTPALGKTILSYGCPLVLGLIGLVYILKYKTFKDKEMFLVVWLIIQGALIYFPFNMQRRFILGLQVVINILAIFGLIYLKNIFKIKRPLSSGQTAILIAGALIVLTGSNYLILIMSFYPIINPGPIYYLENSRLEAMQWLKNNTSPKSVVLSSCPNCNLIPAFGLRRVYLGHWDFTVNSKQKLALLNYFFQKNNPNDGRKNFLLKNNINYIFYSKKGEGFGPFNPNTKSYLKEVYQNPDITIYQVNQHAR